ncbi:MAG: alpha/beta fold hydrolase [Flavobacteriaceae bacterium]
MGLAKRCFILLLFVSSTCLFAQDSIPKLIPLDVLFKKPDRSHFAISPNGKYYIEVIEKSEDSYLFKHSITLNIVDIDKYELAYSIPLDIFGIDAVYWLSDDRIIYESKGSIKAINLDGTNPVVIVSRMDFGRKPKRSLFGFNFHYNSILNPLYNKPHQILVETHDAHFNAAVKEINIYTGEEYVVMNEDLHKVNHWITDVFGNIRMAMKVSEQGMRYYYTYDAETKTLKPFFVKLEGDLYSLTIDPKTHLKQYLTFEGFGNHPNEIFLTSNIFTDKREMFSYDIEKEEVIEKFVADVNCDVKDLDGEGISFILDYKNAEIAGFKYTCLTPKYKWLSSPFAEKMTKLDKQYPGFFNEIIDLDISGNRLLIHQWNDSSNGNIGVYDVAEDTYAIMYLFNEELSHYKLSKSKVIIAKTRDHYNVPCYFNLPVAPEEGASIPLVVIPHGGPWARDYWQVDDFTQYFTSRGFATLRINYRGSTGFGKSHVLAGLHSLDEVMINDIVDATLFVSERFNIDKDHIFLFGHSYGGYATYMGLVKYPNLFKAGISVAAPTDIMAWLKKQKEEENYYAYEFWNTALGSNDSKYLKKISPITYAEEINRPLFIIHGRRDGIVPVEQAEAMIKKLQKSKKDFEFKILEFSNHSFTDEDEFEEMLENSNRFFQKYLVKEE